MVKYLSRVYPQFTDKNIVGINVYRKFINLIKIMILNRDK